MFINYKYRSKINTLIIWVLILSCSREIISATQDGLNKTEAHQNMTSNSTEKLLYSSNVGIDDILKDTFGLLDLLDQKLIAIHNRTPSALIRETPRSLESQVEPIELSAKQDNISSVDSSPVDNGDTIEICESSSLEEKVSEGQSKKKARQLNKPDDNHLEEDTTDKHIKFTLDLMQSIFQSQLYSSDTNSIESFLISPLSIQMILMMMHLGARGHTKREIANCLHLSESSDRISGLLDVLGVNPDQSYNSTNNLNKLKRRHQIAGSSEFGMRHSPQAEQRNKRPTAAMNQHKALQNTHELLSSSLKNLLKDPLVMKGLTSANQILIQKSLPLNPKFEQAVRQHYATDLRQVDFQNQSDETKSSQSNSTSQIPTSRDDDALSIQQQVNEWVERQSKGKISNFLTSPVPASTLLMAINVLFFKGEWQYRFDPADTETDAWFTQADGKTVKIPMMVNKLPVAFAHDPVMKTSVIELPYRAQRLGLFILLPDEVSGIFHTMQMLNSSSFANLISSMRRSSSSTTDLSGNGINVRIPKFSIDSTPKISQILSQYLGLKSLFTPDMADLSGLFMPQNKQRTLVSATPLQTMKKSSDDDTIQANSQTQNIQVGLDELIHKAILQVDEQGSVAAASSAAIVERVGLFNANYFEADHPFLIFLMDKQTGLVLFSGVFAGDKETKVSGFPSSRPINSTINAATLDASLTNQVSSKNSSSVEGNQRRPTHF